MNVTKVQAGVTRAQFGTPNVPARIGQTIVVQKKRPDDLRRPARLVPSPRYFAKNQGYCRAVVPLKQLEPLPAALYLITPDWSEQKARCPVCPAAVGTPVDE